MILVIYTKKYNISVIFPAFNEEKNITKVIEKTIKILSKIAKEYEIIIVNDGSTDRTKEVVEKIMKNKKTIILINHPVNRGMGAALTTGFNIAKHDILFYADSDGQIEVNDLIKYINLINIYPIIIGFRNKRSDPFHRILLSKSYNVLFSFLFGLNIKDANCSFKIFRKNLWKEIKVKSKDFFFDVEFLTKLNKKGYKIMQVPIKHYPRKSGLSKMDLKNAFSLSIKLFKFWLNNGVVV